MSMNTRISSQIHTTHKKNSNIVQKMFNSGYELDAAARIIPYSFNAREVAIRQRLQRLLCVGSAFAASRSPTPPATGEPARPTCSFPPGVRAYRERGGRPAAQGTLPRRRLASGQRQ